MKIALSVDALSHKLTGIGRYCKELAVGLPMHSDIKEVCYFIDAEPVKLNQSGFLCENRYGSRQLKKVIKRFRALKMKSSLSSFLVHSPNYFLPSWSRRGVITAHDLSVFLYPDTHPVERVIDFEKNFLNSINKSAHIIVDSESVRKEIISFTGVPSSMVTAVPLGINKDYRPRNYNEIYPIIKRFNIEPFQYGLCVSTLEPRKRIHLLLEAWCDLPRKIRDRFPLVLVGGSGWNNLSLLNRMEGAARDGWLINLGYVSEVELTALYAGARVFAYPSVYEGFGLPPLEAMSSGVPTIVADIPCLAEVTRGAAELVNPEDTPELIYSIERALEDQKWRNRQIVSGLNVAKDYTWERCVNETVKVYEKANLN